MKVQQALQSAVKTLTDTSPSANLDAQILLSYILNCNRAHLIAWPEKELSLQQIDNFQKLITQRQHGSPVAHLTGQREFWSLNFKVNNSTLIPRPETETLIEFILEKFGEKKTLTLLDIGTGTGAIAITLANEKPDWRITATDISAAAIALAKENSAMLNTENIALLQSDWFTNIPQQTFDIIVSNPPYISTNDPHLTKGDVRFEPKSALTSGKTGMDDIEHLCSQAKNYLAKDGWLIIEHGYNQKTATAECFTRNDYKNISQQNDLAGHCRMTAGSKF